MDFIKNRQKVCNFSVSNHYDDKSKIIVNSKKNITELNILSENLDETNNIFDSSKNLLKSTLPIKDNLETILNKSQDNRKNFISLGIFYLENLEKTQKIYLDILHRNINTGNNNILDDYFFYDISELINYKHQILEENDKKNKIFEKIAHEFKTPLNTIIGLIDEIYILDYKLPKIIYQNLDLIKNLTNYAIFLISDIIHFVYNSETNDLKLNLFNFNIRDSIKFCFEILKTLILCSKSKKENISPLIIMDNDIDLYELKCDEIKIKQIILNLISNSVKFTKIGKIILKCKKKEINGEKYLKISVKDTGIGFKNDEEFYDIDEYGRLPTKIHEKSKIFGKGFGLLICKNLAEKMNFKFIFKSQLNKGSTFSIIIPSFCIEKNNKPISKLKKLML